MAQLVSITKYLEAGELKISLLHLTSHEVVLVIQGSYLNDNAWANNCNWRCTKLTTITVYDSWILQVAGKLLWYNRLSSDPPSKIWIAIALH